MTERYCEGERFADLSFTEELEIYEQYFMGDWEDENYPEHTFTLSAPPNRNLVKLEFRTKGKHLDLEWLKVPSGR